MLDSNFTEWTDPQWEEFRKRANREGIKKTFFAVGITDSTLSNARLHLRLWMAQRGYQTKQHRAQIVKRRATL